MTKAVLWTDIKQSRAFSILSSSSRSLGEVLLGSNSACDRGLPRVDAGTISCKLIKGKSPIAHVRDGQERHILKALGEALSVFIALYHHEVY